MIEFCNYDAMLISLCLANMSLFLICSFLLQLAAVQVSPSQLAIENFITGYCQDLKTDIHIKGVFVTKVSYHGCYITNR